MSTGTRLCRRELTPSVLLDLREVSEGVPAPGTRRYRRARLWPPSRADSVSEDDWPLWRVESLTAAEQAVDTADKDMMEQTQGMERYRKRKVRNKDGTTEEALLEVVANRKISRKINYDAMSSIFDDGSFSTGGVDIEDSSETREKMSAEEV